MIDHVFQNWREDFPYSQPISWVQPSDATSKNYTDKLLEMVWTGLRLLLRNTCNCFGKMQLNMLRMKTWTARHFLCRSPYLNSLNLSFVPCGALVMHLGWLCAQVWFRAKREGCKGDETSTAGRKFVKKWFHVHSAARNSGPQVPKKRIRASGLNHCEISHHSFEFVAQPIPSHHWRCDHHDCLGW